MQEYNRNVLPPEAQLQKAPAFDSWDKFPNITASNWDAELVRYWGVR